MKLYGLYVLFIEGALQSECTAVDTELASDDQEVLTITLGLAGVSPAPDIRRITYSGVSPVEGEDFDFEQAKLNRTVLSLKLQQVGSGKVIISKGIIRNVRRRGAVGETSTIEFEFVGTASAMA